MKYAGVMNSHSCYNKCKVSGDESTCMTPSPKQLPSTAMHFRILAMASIWRANDALCHAQSWSQALFGVAYCKCRYGLVFNIFPTVVASIVLLQYVCS